MPKPKAKSKQLGSSGESFAVRLLRQKGYKILTKNFHARVGELDIVAMDGKTLVFVEVKTRRGDKYGLPEEAVTKRKLAHIIKSGYEFIQKMRPKYKKLRVDVVALTVEENQVKRSKIIKVDEV